MWDTKGKEQLISEPVAFMYFVLQLVTGSPVIFQLSTFNSEQ